MLRSIMTPLDGSPSAEHALPWTRYLARHTGAAIHLVRVREITPVPATGDGLIPNDASVIEEVIRMENEYRDQILANWRDDESQISVTSTVLEPNDSTAAMLCQYATDHAIDLTVMTTHGRGRISRALFGSVTDQYLRHATCPTLLIRNQSEVPPDRTLEPVVKRVIVPLDGSQLSEQAIEPAVRLFEWFGCEIVLMLVIDAVDDIYAFIDRIDGPLIPQAKPQAVKEIAEEYLRGWASKLTPKSGRITTKIVEHGSAAEAILKEASAAHSAIAMATHGRGGLSRAIFGSTADEVIRGATTGPVLIVRPTEAKT